MSIIALEDIKRDLRVTHDSDDALLQVLLDASEDEALRFLNHLELPTLEDESPSSEDPIAPSVYSAVFLLVRSKYDSATADEITRLRQCAETILMPYRTEMGV